MIGEVLEFAGLLRRKSWSRARLDELRRAKLRRLIHHAYHSVPYYRRLMEKAGVRPEDVDEPSDLRKLPVTTKQELRDAGEDCLARGCGELTVRHTSGHSGVPFEVRVTPAECRTRRLREFRMLMGAGVRPRDRLTLLGPLRTAPRRLHRRIGLYRMEVIPGNLPDQEMVRRLQESRPDVLWAYPTVLKTVLYRAGCGLSGLAKPRLLITSAQVMESALRTQLRADLPEMDIASIYGSAEAGRIAAECRWRRGLHLEDDALIVELVENGSPVEPGCEGTVVLTCLDQLAMPLIRYEQGDRCRLRPTPCSCGWQTPVMDAPAGRNADMVTLPSGRKISVLPLDVALRDQTDLLQYRFVQKRLDRIESQLCYRTPPPDEQLQKVRRRLEEALPEGMEVHIRLIPEMRFEGVKFKVFVSELEGSS